MFTKYTARLAALTLAGTALLPPGAHATPTTLLDSLGQAGQYAVFSLGGTYQNQSNVHIYGNVGVGPKGSASVMAPSTVTGTIYKDPTATVSGPGQVSGGIVTQSMQQAVSDALNAAATFSAMTPTVLLSSINTNTTLTGNGATNVIKLSGSINLSGSNNLTLTGSANDRFIFNITGSLQMDGSSQVLLTGGVLAQNVVFNFLGGGGQLMTHVGNAVQGIILAPKRDITFHGLFGEVIGGGKNLTLMSGATVTGFPTENRRPVPDPGSTLTLASLGFMLLAVIRTVFGAKARIQG
jgi:hypothetical protein